MRKRTRKPADTVTRRDVLAHTASTLFAGALGLGALAGCAGRPESRVAGSLAGRAAVIEFENIERSAGGRLGIAALNLGSGERLEYRSHERHAMCSTFKWLLAVMILKRVDRGELALSDERPIASDALVHYSPGTEPYAGQTMTLSALCDAMLTLSDNTAANVLLEVIGGPPAFTADVRGFGDRVTRLDRLEPELNENNRGDPRDTTTPAAMLDLMQRILFGSVLSSASLLQLRDWMVGTKTGARRLRAGFDASWQVGNRTGTSNNNQSNDLAFAVSLSQSMVAPGPILIASYANVPEPMAPTADAVHEQIAREVLRRLT